MRARSQRSLSRINAIAAILLLPISTGCLLGNVETEAEAKPAPERVVRTPDKLLDDLQVAQREAKQTAQLYETAGGAFRRDLVRKHINGGSETADELLAHIDVDKQQAQIARHAKVELLGLGVRKGWSGYADQLATLLEQLNSEHPQSAETALADSILLERKYIRRGAKLDEALTALKAHVATFSDHSTGLVLFKQFVGQLITDQRISDAKACCQVALHEFGNDPQAAPFKRLLRQLAKNERSVQDRKAYVATIKAKLGGHNDGYFVIFVHRPVITEGSAVDYHVSEGLAKAVAYVGALSKEMVWELSGWFPRTSEGRKKARALCNKLIERNTYPMYQPPVR